MTHLIKNVCERAYLCFMCLKVLFQIETTQLEHWKINSHPSWQNMYHNVVLQLPILVVILVAWLMRNEWELNPKKQKKLDNLWNRICFLRRTSTKKTVMRLRIPRLISIFYCSFNFSNIPAFWLSYQYSEFLFETFKVSNYFICAFLHDFW